MYYIIWSKNKRAMVKGLTDDLEKAEAIYNEIIASGRHAFLTVDFVSPQVEHVTPAQLRAARAVVGKRVEERNQS